MKIKSAILAAAAAVFISLPAQAIVTISIEQVGADVVITGSGTINTTALTAGGSGSSRGSLESTNATVLVSGNSFSDLQVFNGISGPASMGTGLDFAADSGTGDIFGVQGGSEIVVPLGYASLTQLDGSSTYETTTLGDLGLTPGTVYTWTWGSDATADSLTVTVVPEPTTYAALFGLGILAWATYRRKR